LCVDPARRLAMRSATRRIWHVPQAVLATSAEFNGAASRISVVPDGERVIGKPP
jgi:hypothetical protein